MLLDFSSLPIFPQKGDIASGSFRWVSLVSENLFEILNYIQLSREGAVLKRNGRDGIWDLHCGYIARDGSMGGYECGTDGLRSLSPDYVHWWLLMAIGRLIGYQPGKDSNHCQSCSMPHECISRSPKCGQVLRLKSSHTWSQKNSTSCSPFFIFDVTTSLEAPLHL